MAGKANTPNWAAPEILRGRVFTESDNAGSQLVELALIPVSFHRISSSASHVVIPIYRILFKFMNMDSRCAWN